MGIYRFCSIQMYSNIITCVVIPKEKKGALDRSMIIVMMLQHDPEFAW